MIPGPPGKALIWRFTRQGAIKLKVGKGVCLSPGTARRLVVIGEFEGA